MSSVSKILIVGPAWVGDMVMAQSLFFALQQRHGEVSIDVLAPDWTSPLLERMPQVRRALVMPLGHGRLGLSERRRLGKSLQGEGYDQAIVLPNSLKSALVPWFARIPLRTGWLGEMRYGLLNDCRPLDKQAFPLMVQRFVALAWPRAGEAPEICAPPALLANSLALPGLRAKLGLDAERPVLVCCPGAEYGPSKQWPAASFAALVREAVSKGWQVWIVGSARDREVAGKIAEGCDSAVVKNLAGCTSLGEVIDLMSCADAVVSNDSGLMHVAAALGRPLVAIYGSTSPGFTPPLGNSVRILTPDLDCSPCFARECPLGHMDCMKQTPASRVSAALSELLGKSWLSGTAGMAGAADGSPLQTE